MPTVYVVHVHLIHACTGWLSNNIIVLCACVSVIQNSVIFLCTGTSTFKVKSQKLIDILLYKKVKGTFFLVNLMTLNA